MMKCYTLYEPAAIKKLANYAFRQNRRYKITLLFVFIMYVFIFIYFMSSSLSLNMPFKAILIVLCFSLFYICLLLCTLYILLWRKRSQYYHRFYYDVYKSPTSEYLTIEYTFTDEGLSVKRTDTYAFYKWDSITDFSSDAGYYYFSVGKKCGIIDKQGFVENSLVNFETFIKKVI